VTVYLTKSFARFARKAGLVSDSLHAAAANVTTWMWAADLGLQPSSMSP